MAIHPNTKSFRTCIIIPVVNKHINCGQLEQKVKTLRHPVYFIYDKKVDCSQLNTAQASTWQFHKLELHQGIGAAIEQGLHTALKDGFEWALTILPEEEFVSNEVENMIHLGESTKDTMIIGYRSLEAFKHHVIKRRQLMVSNFLFWLETGLNIPDSNSSIRIYPIAAIQKLTFRFHKGIWETESLVRMCWGGVKIASIELPHYEIKDSPTPLLAMGDNFKIAAVHSYLILRRLLPIPFRVIIKAEKIKWPTGLKRKITFAWKRFFWQVNETPSEIAFSVSFGLFAGLLPNFGTQSIVALYFAQRLHLNKVVVLICSLISLTPLLPFIFYLDLVVGRFVRTGHLNWNIAMEHLTWITIKAQMNDFVIGSFIVAFTVALFTWFVMYWLVLFGKKLRTEHSTKHVNRPSFKGEK